MEKIEELKNFIKTLNILYVEDEVNAREITAKIFRRFFNDVETKENGLEGYLAFQKKYAKNESYDLIISDINMPKMDGLDMVDKIREINKDIPVIFITARHEPEVLQRAIEQQVLNYLIKPLDMESVAQTIYKSCEKIYLKNLFIKKQRELEVYLKTIEQIAFILKLDLDENITYVNDAFCEILGLKSNDMLGKKIDFLKISDADSFLYEELDKALKSGKIWEGNIKTKTSDDETIYLKSVIMPIFDDSNKNIIEFLSIFYLTTDQENEKKLLVKKMFQSIANLKKEAHTNFVEKEKKEEEVKELKKLIFSLEEQVSNLLHTKTNLLSQLNSYEMSKLNQSSGKLDLLKQKNSEAEALRKSVYTLKNEKNLFTEKISDLENSLNHSHNLIEFMKNNESKLNARIRGLQDIVQNLEKQMDELQNEKKGLFN